MKLTPEQLAEKKARDNIKRLKNRVTSEYSFKKWRDYHSYLYSMGVDKAFIDEQQNRELTRQELDDLLNKYEDEAIKNLINSSIVSRVDNKVNDNTERPETLSKEAVKDSSDSLEIKEGASNNYGLSKSPKEAATLTWFQKKAAAELLQGIL